MTFEDKAKHAAETAKGAVKETAGRLKDDPELELEGTVERAKGHLKQAMDEVKKAVKR